MKDLPIVVEKLTDNGEHSHYELLDRKTGEKITDNLNDPISAFAYRTAREIEEIINKRTNSLHDTNQLLEAKIIDFYRKIQADNNNSIAGKWVDIYKETFDLDVSPF